MSANRGELRRHHHRIEAGRVSLERLPLPCWRGSRRRRSISARARRVRILKLGLRIWAVWSRRRALLEPPMLKTLIPLSCLCLVVVLLIAF